MVLAIIFRDFWEQHPSTHRNFPFALTDMNRHIWTNGSILRQERLRSSSGWQHSSDLDPAIRGIQEPTDYLRSNLSPIPSSAMITIAATIAISGALDIGSDVEVSASVITFPSTLSAASLVSLDLLVSDGGSTTSPVVPTPQDGCDGVVWFAAPSSDALFHPGRYVSLPLLLLLPLAGACPSYTYRAAGFRSRPCSSRVRISRPWLYTSSISSDETDDGNSYPIENRMEWNLEINFGLSSSLSFFTISKRLGSVSLSILPI